MFIYYLFCLQERLEYIENDQCEYTLDEEDRKIQDVILRPEPLQNDTAILKKTLSCSYPNMPFEKALRKENEKLQLELQRSQAHLDVGQCEVIQRLIEVTEAASSHSLPENGSPEKRQKKIEHNYSDTDCEMANSFDENYHKKSDTYKTSRSVSFLFATKCSHLCTIANHNA